MAFDSHRPRVLFVAGLTSSPSGAAGGQLTVASTLFRSELGRRFELVPLTSTAESIPPPPMRVRALAAARRLGTFASAPARGVRAALIFSSDGLSLVEKGLMCMLARAAGLGVVVRFSSGALPGQVAANPALDGWLRGTLASAHVVVSQGARWTEFFGSYPEAAGKILEAPNITEIPPLTSARRDAVLRFVFVGWITREKGVFELLEAFARLHRDVPDARLTFAGGGRDLEELRAEVRRAGLEAAISTPGWVDRDTVRTLLAEAEAFVLPSHFEGLPNAMLEAMAAELPVVVTPVGSVPDVIEDGENGLLVPPKAPAALERALRRLIAEPTLARRLGQRARQRVIERFAPEVVWPRYAEAIERAITEAAEAAGPRSRR